jgi:hypothetical protein
MSAAMVLFTSARTAVTDEQTIASRVSSKKRKDDPPKEMKSDLPKIL